MPTRGLSYPSLSAYDALVGLGLRRFFSVIAASLRSWPAFRIQIAAPAAGGQEAAYAALYRALVAYRAGLPARP